MNADPILTRLTELLDVARSANDLDPLECMPDPDDPLVAYVDSLGLSTLVLLVEEEWDLEFSEDDLDPDNLDSLAALGRFVRRVEGRR